MLYTHITHAVIEATSRCNFTCGFCAGRHMPQGDLPISSISRILSQLPKLQHVYLSGEGEGFLNPHFFEMAQMIKSRSITLYHVTNGSLLTMQRIREVLRIGFAEINISTETLNKELFHRLRGGDLSKIIDNIRSLSAARGQTKYPIIRLNFNALKSTLHEVKEVERFSMKLGIERPNIFSLQKKNTYSRYYSDDLKSEILTETQYDVLMNYVLANPAPAQFWNTLYSAGSDSPCPFLGRFIWVAHDGYMAPCCYIKEINLFGMGNALHKGGIEAGFSSAAFMSLDHDIRSGELPLTCEGCTVFKVNRAGINDTTK